MNFKDIKNINIPEGVVSKITTLEGVVLWERVNDYIFEMLYTTTDGKIVNPSGIASSYTLISNTYKNSVGNFKFRINDAKIPSYLFYDKDTLTSITIPEGIIEIGGTAFSSCNYLSTINFPSTLKIINNSAFQSISVASISLPNGFEKIGDSAFENSSISNINIPDSTKYIGIRALYNTAYLSYLTLPKDLEYIGFLALPRNKSIYTNSTRFLIKNNCLIDNQENKLIEGLKNTSNYIYNIPDSITTLGQQCFRECNKIQEIVIPDTVNQVEGGIFNSCTSLSSVTLSKNITTLSEGFFAGCTALTNFVIPDTILEIGEAVFNGCTNLTSITLNNNIQNIKYQCFRDCRALSTIEIPQSVEYIESSAFTNCRKLRTITSLNLIAPRIENNTFYNVGIDISSDKILYVPQNAIGYDVWLENLPDGFTIEYIE